MQAEEGRNQGSRRLMIFPRESLAIFPKIGVRSLFSKGEDGRLKIRRVAHQGRSYTYLLMSIDIDDFMQNQ